MVKKRGEEGTDLVQGVIPWLALWYVPVMNKMDPPKIDRGLALGIGLS